MGKIERMIHLPWYINQKFKNHKTSSSLEDQMSLYVTDYMTAADSETSPSCGHHISQVPSLIG